ncbi:hypothetical protein F5Y09DRAFT_323623 [Xylaria sp. FL1042]|nr:hypothetical protein F5Y09DRAFT_323623 [Xylaria sp. FL1042]
MSCSATETRLLPSLVDELAQSDPSRVLYSVAKTKNPADGFRDISAAEVSRAVDRCSWLIENALGRGVDFPTILYLGPQDLNYAIILLASIKTGYKLLLSSPRNTLEAHLLLLDKTNCDIFLYPKGFPLPIINQILVSKKMRNVEVPWVNDWLDVNNTEERPYPYDKIFSEARDEPFVVLHTSGSTGLPKPIIQTHGLVSAVDAFTTLDDAQTIFPILCKGRRVYSAFPLFHCAGINTLLPGCLYGGFTVVLGPFPPSADIANSVHVYGDVQMSVLVPTTITELIQNPEYVDNLSRLERICFGGGPCPKSVGDLVSTKTRLMSCLGSTECGIMPCQVPSDPQDWQYLRIHPILGCEYRHVSDNMYEQVIVRNESRCAYQGVFAAFPGLTEWPMKDLYSKHPDPTKSDHWLYQGRSDDIIVFANGEKLNAIDMESVITSNPVISAALVAGQGRFQTSLLVESVNPPTDTQEKDKLLEAIWPSVQTANKICPSHGCISRNMIIFTSPGKPMPRAGKGTVQRKMTLDLYASELNSLYDTANEPLRNGASIFIGGDHNGTEMTIRNIIASCTSIDINLLLADTNFFDMGMNSLHVMEITKKLTELAISRGKPRSIKPEIIYTNPTLAALTSAVSNIIDGDGRASVKNGPEYLEGLYKRYTASLPISGRPALPKSSELFTILMTGSTGSLGSYILDSLQQHPGISKIYCLCRGPGVVERQMKLQTSRGLHPLSSRVQVLDADFSQPYFGLSLPLYKMLLETVTHVIHNAWRVDFNLSIDSFTSHISGVREFVNFSALSRFSAQLFFVSSISTVAGLGSNVCEKIYTDWSTPDATGYGQSKFLSERILDAAARDAGIPTTICRVGQVAGPTSVAGEWPKREWLPSLIASSKYMGKVPASLGRLETVDWIPVDILGDIIIELALSSLHINGSKTGATVYHCVNPRTTTWAELLPSVIQNLGGENAIEVVPLDAWVDALRESTSEMREVAANPATKLVDFYDSLIRGNEMQLGTEHSLGVSKTLSTVGPVRLEWMDNWMKQWAF